MRWILLLLLASAALAGCTDDPDHGDDVDPGAGHDMDDGMDMGGNQDKEISYDNPFESFEEAAAAPGTTETVTMGDETFQVKLVEPTDPEATPTGIHRVLLVISTDDGATPMEGARVDLYANMPAMNHGACSDRQMEDGTCPEEDPRHVGHGVYIGKTDLFMQGQWRLDLELYPTHDAAQPALLDFPVRTTDSA